MGTIRKLSEQEVFLLRFLLNSQEDCRHLADSIETAVVSDMVDGGMGSLRFIPADAFAPSCSFGRQVVEAEFTDSDGVLVSVTVNTDQAGNLYELDIWKTDFSKLLAYPKAVDVRIH